MKKTHKSAHNRDNQLFPLEELVRRIEAAVTASAIASHGDRRVARVPDARTIRYYNSLALVDSPAAYRGGRAFYGHRHFLQVAAVKALQAQYLPLAKVQERLLGLDNAQLAEIAAPLLGKAETSAAPVPRRPLSSRAFWKEKADEKAEAPWRTTHEIELQPGVWLRVASDADVPQDAQTLSQLLNKAKRALSALRNLHLDQPDQGESHE